MRLLLIDDDGDRRALMRRLTGEGTGRFEIVEAATAGEAWRAGPLLDGALVEASRVAAAVEALSGPDGEVAVPVVALTRDDASGDGAAALRAGAQEHLCAEALGPEGVARVVTGVVERHRLARALRESEARLARAMEDARALRRHEDDLLAADQRKDAFVAMIAHELRGPLAPIRTAVAALRQREGDARRARCEDVIERQVEHLARLVDDLLDLSRVTQGKLALRRAPVDLGEVARRALEATQALFDRRDQRLSVSLPDEALWVEGDAVRLTQVVVNLLTNAAKYTDDGGRVALAVSRGPAGFARVLVRDDGQGLDDEARRRVFDPFYQSARSLPRSDGGLGIGLALVRSLVEMHGGAVTARSEGVGAGSEFEVSLPLLPPRRPRVDAPAHASR